MQGKIQETIRISFNLKLTVLVESRVEDDVVTLNLRVIMKVVSKATGGGGGGTPDICHNYHNCWWSVLYYQIGKRKLMKHATNSFFFDFLPIAAAKI